MGFGKFLFTPAGQIRFKLLLAAGGNFPIRSVIFKFLSLGNSLEFNRQIDHDFLLYIQKHVNSLITVAALPKEMGELKDHAVKILNEGYDKYVEYVKRQFTSPSKSKILEKAKKVVQTEEKRKEQVMKTLHSVTTNKDGSIKGFKNLNDLFKSASKIIGNNT